MNQGQSSVVVVANTNNNSTQPPAIQQRFGEQKPVNSNLSISEWMRNVFDRGNVSLSSAAREEENEEFYPILVNQPLRGAVLQEEEENYEKKQDKENVSLKHRSDATSDLNGAEMGDLRKRAMFESPSMTPPTTMQEEQENGGDGRNAKILLRASKPIAHPTYTVASPTMRMGSGGSVQRSVITMEESALYIPSVFVDDENGNAVQFLLEDEEDEEEQKVMERAKHAGGRKNGITQHSPSRHKNGSVHGNSSSSNITNSDLEELGLTGIFVPRDDLENFDGGNSYDYNQEYVHEEELNLNDLFIAADSLKSPPIVFSPSSLSSSSSSSSSTQITLQQPEEEKCSNKRVLAPHMQVAAVYVTFCNVTPEKAQRGRDGFMGFITRIQAQIINGYSHCELLFMLYDTEKRVFSRVVSSILFGRKLRMVDKKYANKKWYDFYRYNCSPEIARRIIEFEYNRIGTPFNKLGYMWNFLVPFEILHLDRYGAMVTCAEEVIRNLKTCEPELYKLLVPYNTHPYTFFAFVYETTNRFVRELEEPTIDRYEKEAMQKLQQQQQKVMYK
jgi:hypothetical protein